MYVCTMKFNLPYKKSNSPVNPPLLKIEENPQSDPFEYDWYRVS